MNQQTPGGWRCNHRHYDWFHRLSCCWATIIRDCHIISIRYCYIIISSIIRYCFIGDCHSVHWRLLSHMVGYYHEMFLRWLASMPGRPGDKSQGEPWGANRGRSTAVLEVALLVPVCCLLDQLVLETAIFDENYHPPGAFQRLVSRDSAIGTGTVQLPSANSQLINLRLVMGQSGLWAL